MSEPHAAVFISYAHIDNESFRPGEGWVEQFEKHLRGFLNKRFGRRVDVWRDPELKRAELFDRVIEKQVRGAGVMILLITEAYLNSRYCRQEIEWFRDEVGAGLVLGDSVRVFPVRLYNIPHTRWPEVCEGTTAFDFFQSRDERDFGRPLDPASKAFETELWRLVEELYDVLTRLEASGAEEGPETPSFRVFLAHPPDDLKPTWRRLAEELAEHGVEVLPRIPPPDEVSEHAAAVQQVMGEADLAVHLMSAQPGEPMDERDPERTFPREQLTLGLEHARSQLVLMPDDLDLSQIADDSYGSLLRSLGETAPAGDRVEQRRVERSRMLEAILDRRRRLEEAARRLEDAARGEQEKSAFRIFLAHPPDDLRPTRRRLARELAREGIEVLDRIPPPEEKAEHAAALKQAVGSADLSVHLLSVQPGEPMDENDPERTFPLEQLALNLEHPRSRILVLMQEGLDFSLVTHASYARFLESLAERRRDGDRLELVQIGRPQMLDQILDKRRRIEEEAARQAEEEAALAEGIPGTAFIDLQTHDVRFATDLVTYLAQKQIALNMVPATDLSPSAGMSEFEENLKKARLFIVVYGDAARTWVDYRLQEAVKIIVSEGLRTRIGIYLAPPWKEKREVEFPALFDVANNMDGFDPRTIEPLLKKAAQTTQ